MLAGNLGWQSRQRFAHGLAGQEIGLGWVVAVAGQARRHCDQVFMGDGRRHQAGQSERQGQDRRCAGRDHPLTAQKQKGQGQQGVWFEDDGRGPQDARQGSVAAGLGAAGPQGAQQQGQGQKVDLSPLQAEQQRPTHGEPQANHREALAAQGDACQACAQSECRGPESEQQHGPQQLGRSVGKQGQTQKGQQRRRRVEETGESRETQSVPDRGLVASLVHIRRQSSQRGFARGVVGREIHLEAIAGKSQPQDRQSQHGHGQGQQQKCTQGQGGMSHQPPIIA